MKQQITKAAIEASFMKLLCDKPFEKVTVRDIVDDCGLTRNTFYYYYEDTYDIVDEILTREIGKQLASCTDANIENALIFSVKFATDNPKLVSHLFNSPKSKELEIYFAKTEHLAISQAVDKHCGERRVSDADRRVICNWLRHSVHGMLVDWLRGGMKYSLEDEVRRSSQLFSDCVEAAIERSLQ